MQFNVSILGLIISVILNMGVGMLWYGPIFGEMWMKLVGITKKDIEKAMKTGMQKTYALALFSAFIMSYVTGIMITNFGAETVFEGMLIGFVLWIGFIATTMFNRVLWENAPTKLYLIQISHFLVVLMLTSIIFVLV